MATYHFDAELAVKIGVEEAVMMNNMVFWIQHNVANNKHSYEGRYWTYNTVQAFSELYPFWTVKQLRRIMESLYNQKVLMKGNFNKKPFDRTGWYSITDEYSYLLDLPKRANVEPETANGNAQTGKTIPTVNTDNQSLFPNNDKIKRKIFVPPTFEEVDQYFKLLKRPEKAKRFFNHFTSNGWLVSGKAKMKDWKAAAQNYADGDFIINNSKFQKSEDKLNGVNDMMQNFNDI